MTKIYNRNNQKQQRKDLRNNMTPAEIILWSKLKNRQMMGYKFRRQYGVGRYIIDFYCPKLRLAIEVDGNIHDLELIIEKDNSRQKYIQSFRIKIKRYTNNDIINNLNGVLKNLRNTIQEIEKELSKINPLLTKEGTDLPAGRSGEVLTA